MPSVRTSICLFCVSGLVDASAAHAQTQSRHLLAISDIDMMATSYHDDQLGPPLNQVDTLSIFDLASHSEKAIASTPASNAMNSPANTMVVTPDGRLALVAATWEQRTAGSTTVSDLSRGRHLRAYDISDRANPRFVGEKEVMPNPTGIAVRPGGDFAVVIGGPISEGLFFVPIADGRLGTPRRVAVPLAPRSDLGREVAPQVRWHPSGKVLAVLLAARSQVAFFRVEEPAGARPRLTPWGTVQVNKYPLVGEFSPDGRFFFTSDVQWGADVPRGYETLSEGVVTTTRLAPLGDRAARPGHIVVGATHGGFNAEFMAISPDGKLLALASIGGTSRPSDDPAYDPNAALTLFSIDPQTGRLSHAGHWPFVATNPQGLAFDASGALLYVGIGEYRGEEAPLKGAIEIWDVIPGPSPSLARTDRRFRAPRGVHTIAIAN